FYMAQHVIPAAQLVPQYKPIGRYNNYAVLQSIPCSPECKITVSKVPDTEDTIKFMLDTQQFTYNVDMFRDTLHLPVETPENPFVAPANINTIETFMNIFSYQGVVDKKKKAIQYPRFIKLIVADLMKKFPDIPKRLEEDYHSIKDDVPLVSAYTTGNVSVQGMLVDVFLTAEIREINDFKKYETVFTKVDVPMNQSQPVVSTQGTHRITHSAHRLPTVFASPPVTKKRKKIAGESKPGSHKDNPEVFDDDDDKEKEKQNDEMGTLEIRNEETQTTIPTLLRVLRRMCRRQGYMIQDMERKCVTTAKFWETHNKIDDILHEVVPQIAENVTNDLIEANLKPCIVNTIIEDRDAFRSEVPAFVSQEFKTHAPKIITKLFEDFVQSNVIHMKRSLQDRANNITLWEALRRKFEKYSTSNTSCREDDFHSHHDEHQDDDAPPEGEKRVKSSKKSKSLKSARGSSSKHSRKDSTTYVSKQQSQHQEWDAWEEENVVDEDEVIPEDVTPELIAESQNVDKRVLTIFDHARIEATLRDSLSNLSRNAEEYAYHLEQSTSFMKNQIVWESRQQDIPRTIPKTLIFYGPQRNPNEPPRPLYNKDLFFLKYGNTEEKKYILSLHKIHAEEFPEPDLEEKLNRWVRKEFKTFNEDARLSIQHWKDSWNKRVYKQNQKKVRKNPEDYYSNHRVTEVVRFVTDQPHRLDFMEQILVMRANDKPDSFSEAEFKYLNKNNIEYLYYLCRSKEIDNQKVKLMNSLITLIRSCVIWERVHDFQLGIESYQMKVNLTAPTLTFPGIEEHAPYTIVDEPRMGLIYLNSKDEKRVMYLEEIVKFFDATLEKVLNEVKLRMFESKFLKKPPLLGELDQDIMKAYKREISKRLSHRQQMRRWESFVNGRPILPMMKRL
ncbi:hypothetical protein Tco_0092104, partial [Tanacetum coccineum]